MFESAWSSQTWKRFVQEGVLDSSRIHQAIVESWYRSRNAQVSPYLDRGRHILSGESLQRQRQKNALLTDIAAPFLEKMDRMAREMGMIALLIDPEGYVLSMKGSENVREIAQKIRFVEGVRWTEAEMGTNAIGTALSLGQPIMVTGSEHYSIASHGWSCAAAPIRNDDGEVLGILDVSCPLDRAHPYMLGIVTQAAYTLEKEVKLRSQRDEMELLQRSMEVLEKEQPLVICTPRESVVAASKSIRQNIPNWRGMRVDEIYLCGYRNRMEVPICSAEHGRFIGKCIYLLKAEEQQARPVFYQDKGWSVTGPFRFLGEAGTSRVFRQTLEELGRVASADIPVFVLGETGTGKEVIARSIHENSKRAGGPFVAVNCGAIPRDLLESELFGYVEGAFSGAKRTGAKGKFQQANQGTIFLDEIGEISHSMQVALLRVLQERKITPLGGSQEVPVDFRVIAATHRNVHQLVKEGKFREDLFYRLYVYPVHVPALRQRAEDIPHLVHHYCEKHDWDVVFPPEFFATLMDYSWPGNIRELMNVLDQLRILAMNSADDILHFLHSLFDQNRALGKNDASSLDFPEQRAEEDRVSLTFRDKILQQQMVEALQKTNGNVSKAAKLLGIPRSTFYKRMNRFVETAKPPRS
ncbi:sigma-54-dependent Fis family transcriptional regulator [Brevibacillus sp. GCM10020057]|uniref:sigma-54-dependent Fis family transcriptional regulator n=1 Tax=Brevibacillus sp. GCM10020057 TaxID=3317327 RepID=UPI0036258D0C